jgi:hypothetical protein
MRRIWGVMATAALAALAGCAEPEVVQIEPQTYQVSTPDWWPVDTQGGAEAGLDYAALGVCPHGYTKLDAQDSWSTLTWKIRCDVPRS